MFKFTKKVGYAKPCIYNISSYAAIVIYFIECVQSKLSRTSHKEHTLLPVTFPLVTHQFFKTICGLYLTLSTEYFCKSFFHGFLPR
jgi:hypothetical protein